MAADHWQKYGTPAWLAELREAGVPVDRQGAWCSEPTGGPKRDWLYTRMATHVLSIMRNLLLLHLIEVDHVEHQSGPQSNDAYWAVNYADDRLRDVVEAVEGSPLKGHVTFVVVKRSWLFADRE